MSGAAAHGLTRDPAAPAWERIGAEFSDVLAAWPALGPWFEIDWHAPRPFAATARVRTAAGTVFVKRHHPMLRSVDDLRCEHRFAAHVAASLARQGVAVPVPLAGRDGATAQLAAGWVWEVLPAVPGHDVYRDTLSWEPPAQAGVAVAAGRALAGLHRAAAGFEAPARRTPWLIGRFAPLDAPDPLAALLGSVGTAALPHAALARWPDWRSRCMQVLGGRLARFAAEPRQPPLWTHGDWHVSNLLWTQAEAAGGAGEVAAVLDFGLADRSCALFDLATAIERNAVAWLDLDSNAPIARPAIARALLDGYHALQPLDRPARRTLAALLPVVHVGFALSEIGYFHVLRGEPDSVALAFETFLLGHASWFDTPDGVSLLAALLD